MSLHSNLDVIDRTRDVSPSRYRAKVAFVSPQHRRLEFESKPECFLGVSLENRNFEPARFHALVEWVGRRFARCTILVGDSIHRITLETRDGATQERALAEALRLGRDFVQHHRDLVDAYRGTTDFKFAACADIQSSPEYAEHYKAIRAYFGSVPSFRESVESFGLNYHRSGWEDLSEDERVYRLSRSCDYFLEEFSVFACLVGRGISVMVYPGSFSTLAEVADGQFPGVSPELRDLTVVSLQLKRR